MPPESIILTIVASHVLPFLIISLVVHSRRKCSAVLFIPLYSGLGPISFKAIYKGLNAALKATSLVYGWQVIFEQYIW